MGGGAGALGSLSQSALEETEGDGGALSLG